MLETQKWYIIIKMFFFLIWWKDRHGNEVSINRIFAAKLLAGVDELMLTYINSYWYRNCFSLPEFPISDTPQMPLQIQPIRKQDTIRSWSRPIATTTRHDEYFCLEVMSSVLAQQRTEKPEIMVPINNTSNIDCKM